VFADVHIETDRLLLRPFTMRDLEAFRTIASQEAILEFLPRSDRMTAEQMKAVLAWLIECYDVNTPERIVKFTLPVVLRDSAEVVGWCGLGPLELDESETELYFVISTEHWGKGFATEAAGALLKYALGTLGVPRVVAVVDPRNGASIRVIEKLGMRRERVVRGLSTEHSDYEEHVLYSIHATDLASTGKAFE
jgi:ribosomal-protein-alanine N-acetyltransferase